MPVPSRTHWAETKYNVTTEFPHLGLHSAAANGNIGLVKYALSHGQPINSVLDGVLPLHAASSGGSDLVVKLLIEQGADVNASRLPRRYLHQHRDNSAPIIGSSGSTPLHFAAANGHTDVVRTLLLHGAHADRPDKHGVTPEMLARENGMDDTAEILREWLQNKDKDLRERGGVEDEVGSLRVDRKPSPCNAFDAIESSVRKRLHVKRSIDRALNTLKPSSLSLSESYSNPASDVPHPRRLALLGRPPSPPSGEHPLFADSSDPNEEEFSRRPSLPHHEYDDLLTPRSAQRPPSAGQAPDAAHLLASGSSRKLGSKYSLRNLFKKAGDGPNLSDSPYSPSSVASTPPSASPSPIPGVVPLPTSPRPSYSLLSSSPHETSPLAIGHRPRMGSDTSVGHQAIDLHRSSAEHSRTRSSSRTGTGSDANAPNSTSPSRPGILLSHGRSSSSGQSQTQGSSFRALRFESSSSNSSLSAKARSGAARVLGIRRSFSPSRVIQSRTSINSLTFREADVHAPESAPAVVADFEDSAVDIDEEEYGEVIERPDGASGSPLNDVGIENRSRDLSAPSSSSSLSPIASLESSVTSTGTEFPFSINQPPPIDVLDEQLIDVPYVSPVTSPGDNRLRGDSISSTSTGGSNDPHLSWSATTATSSSGSGGMMTPAMISHLALANPIVLTPSSIPRDLLAFAVESKEEPISTSEVSPPSFSTRRPHAPVDIDIRSISSHAQAEVLVQRAQQSILDMEGMSDDEALSTGRTPLSAKLAAYGESLALERRLKQAEEGKEGNDVRLTEGRGIFHSRSATFVREGDVKNGGPRAKPSINSHRSPVRHPRRPNTSDSVSSAKASLPFMTNERSSRPHHQQSHSASAVESHSSAKEMRGDYVTVSKASALVPVSQPTYLSLQSPEFSPGFLPRSRTPDPLTDQPTSTGRVQLSRYSTAPTQDSFADILAAESAHDPVTRHMVSATKLTKMGFSAKEGLQPTATISVSPRQEHKSRFGIKSLFKGKS